MTQKKDIGIDYTEPQIRVLVEEYIIRQRGTFSFRGVCDYILYWAMEDGHTISAGTNICESNQLCIADCERVKVVLKKIAIEGRIEFNGDSIIFLS